MKLLLSLLFLACTFVSRGQDSLIYLHIKNGTVYYERVFDLPNRDKEGVRQYISEFLPKVAGISDYKENQEGATARFLKAPMPYKKYGLNDFNSGALIRSPFMANIDIKAKEGRYKVIVTGIFFESEMSITFGSVSGNIEGGIEEIAYIKRKDKLVTSDNKVKFPQAKAFQDYMSDVFQPTQNEGSEW